jgi:hypothetical protein
MNKACDLTFMFLWGAIGLIMTVCLNRFSSVFVFPFPQFENVAISAEPKISFMAQAT